VAQQCAAAGIILPLTLYYSSNDFVNCLVKTEGPMVGDSGEKTADGLETWPSLP